MESDDQHLVLANVALKTQPKTHTSSKRPASCELEDNRSIRIRTGDERTMHSSFKMP